MRSKSISRFEGLSPTGMDARRYPDLTIIVRDKEMSHETTL